MSLLRFSRLHNLSSLRVTSYLTSTKRFYSSESEQSNITQRIHITQIFTNSSISYYVGIDVSVKNKLTGKAIYLDVQATTPTDPRVLDAMLPYFTHIYGNPHSKSHEYGWESIDAIEDAREVRIE